MCSYSVGEGERGSVCVVMNALSVVLMVKG